jgi:hypothetical protein
VIGRRLRHNVPRLAGANLVTNARFAPLKALAAELALT